MIVVWTLVTAVQMAGMISALNERWIHYVRIDRFESIYKVSEFNPRNISLMNMVVNKVNQDVIIGAVNHLYRLDSNLKMKVDARTGPRYEATMCAPTYKSTCHNYNKVLVIDYGDNMLITCGTLFHGFCKKRDPYDAFFPASFNHNLRVSNDPQSKVVAFIAPGPILNSTQRDVLYLSLSMPLITHMPGRMINIGSIKLENFQPSFESPNMNVNDWLIKQNPVDFKYGFSSGNFSYMLSVQKIFIDESLFISKISRVCQNDPYLHSYVDVLLSCRRGKIHYNILQAAYTTNAGTKLAESLGTDIKEDVLYGLFSVSKPSFATPTEQNALCIYPLEDIRKKFTENIDECFISVEDTGGKHLGDNTTCKRNQNISIDTIYCADQDTILPLIGKFPLEKEALMVFPTSIGIVTSLRVDATKYFTVAFVGTQSGLLVKVEVENMAAANIYEVVDTGLGSAFQIEIRDEDNINHLYIMTSSKVVKMIVAECSQYKTKTECMVAKNPYCGYCNFSSSCSIANVCLANWTHYDDTTELAKIPVNNEQPLLLDLQIPPDFNGSVFHCLFRSLPGDDNPVFPVVFIAQVSDHDFKCNTPKGGQLPDIKAGRDYVEMELTALADNFFLHKQIVKFFDCSVHSSCKACTQSQFPCSWCIKTNQCTSSVEIKCVNDILVFKPNTYTDIPNPVLNDCPQFRNAENGVDVMVTTGSIDLHDQRCRLSIKKSMEEPTKEGMVQGSVYNIVCRQLVAQECNATIAISTMITKKINTYSTSAKNGFIIMLFMCVKCDKSRPCFMYTVKPTEMEKTNETMPDPRDDTIVMAQCEFDFKHPCQPKSCTDGYNSTLKLIESLNVTFGTTLYTTHTLESIKSVYQQKFSWNSENITFGQCNLYHVYSGDNTEAGVRMTTVFLATALIAFVILLGLLGFLLWRKVKRSQRMLVQQQQLQQVHKKLQRNCPLSTQINEEIPLDGYSFLNTKDIQDQSSGEGFNHYWRLENVAMTDPAYNDGEINENSTQRQSKNTTQASHEKLTGGDSVIPDSSNVDEIYHDYLEPISNRHQLLEVIIDQLEYADAIPDAIPDDPEYLEVIPDCPEYLYVIPSRSEK